MKNIFIAIGIFVLSCISAFLGIGFAISALESFTTFEFIIAIFFLLSFSASIFLSLRLYKKETVSNALLIVLGIVLLLLTAFCSIPFFLGFMDEPNAEMSISGAVAMVSFLFPMVVIAKKQSQVEKAKKKDKLARKDKLAQEQGFLNHQEKTFRTATYTLTHVLGLPVMQGAVCKVISERDKLTIEAQKTVYNLNKDRITSISRETNIQKYSQAVSSIGGAVVGGMLFGSIGAAIGGRATSKDFQSEHQYLVIAYIGDDEAVKYVVFDYTYKSQSLIRDFELFNKTNLQKRNVEIK